MTHRNNKTSSILKCRGIDLKKWIHLVKIKLKNGEDFNVSILHRLKYFTIQCRKGEIIHTNLPRNWLYYDWIRPISLSTNLMDDHFRDVDEKLEKRWKTSNSNENKTIINLLEDDFDTNRILASFISHNIYLRLQIRIEIRENMYTGVPIQDIFPHDGWVQISVFRSWYRLYQHIEMYINQIYGQYKDNIITFSEIKIDLITKKQALMYNRNILSNHVYIKYSDWIDIQTPFIMNYCIGKNMIESISRKDINKRLGKRQKSVLNRQDSSNILNVSSSSTESSLTDIGQITALRLPVIMIDLIRNYPERGILSFLIENIFH